MEPDLLNKKILALTWKQPFATLMLKGKWETRNWKTDYRGLVMICAGKQFYSNDELIQLGGEYQWDRIIKNVVTDSTLHKYGHAIAIGKLTDCREMKATDEDRCFVLHRPGLFVHVYDDVRPIEPIPWKGSQGWTEVPMNVKEQINFV